MRITFTGETCFWPSWLWLSCLSPSWLWLSWFWVKFLSFSSLGGGDAPPFSPPPPPWHHFPGSNVDLKQKNVLVKVELSLSSSCQVELELSCGVPVYRPHPLLDTTAQLLSLRGDLSFRNICIRLEDCQDDNYFLEIFASDCRRLSWWQLFSPPSSLGHGRAPQRNASPCSKGFQFLSLSHKWFMGEMADVYRRKLWCIQMILITRMCALNEFSWQAWLLVWETAPGFLGHKEL